jgi:prepilin-type processing-associated H-X9-DG protein/prepilin-type N-terminal cleavage/methylation domain-containing protein
MRSSLRNKMAFTLVELLVVIAIIALLLAILMPALGRAKAQALTVVCGTKMKNLATADLMYASQYGTIAPPCRFAFGIRPVFGADGSVAFIGTGKDGWADFKKYVRYDRLKGDRKTKAFTTGDLYPFLKSADVFVCPGIPKVGPPPDDPDYFGFDKGHGYTPRWSYLCNTMPAMCQPAGVRYTNCINPDMVKPSPGNVLVFLDRAWKGSFAFHNTVTGFSRVFDKNNSKDVENYNILSEFHTEGGNIAFFDGHVEYMKRTTFLDKQDSLKDRRGTLDFFGGYWELARWDWGGNEKSVNP